MVRRIIQLIGLLFGGMAGNWVHSWTSGGAIWNQPSFDMLQRSSSYYMNVAIGAVAGVVLATLASGRIIRFLQSGADRAAQMPLKDLTAAAGGLLVGLVLSVLLYPAISGLEGPGVLLPAALSLGLGYLGMQVAWHKREELAAATSALFEARKAPAPEEENRGFEEHKILDTSVIIDGRIADICKTGFIEGTLVIPEFVLEELQHIADSSDLLKRNRGRRGLDILNKIQKELDVRVLIYEGDFEEISEVDSKLVKLAKALRGKVVTNDFNLNKVCELQGVSVLNINDLANAVKPVVLPGEEIIVQVIKDGKEHGQGVAYLDDGTMIVVEGGRDYIGTTMEVLVTSVLQTSAGRMIFAKPKLLEKAL
ncbi:PIN/TRAM domain-containing protein [Paenibacillus sp. NPDC058071]|uniref:PIN/TRAM domain-containing protein n=1 Tax=Paenibacillus sp. NPDC058071 TaxID=3346326 RepID=UPI0036D79BAA